MPQEQREQERKRAVLCCCARRRVTSAAVLPLLMALLGEAGSPSWVGFVLQRQGQGQRQG